MAKAFSKIPIPIILFAIFIVGILGIFVWEQIQERIKIAKEYKQEAESKIQEIEKYLPKAGVEEKYTGWEFYRNEVYKFELQYPKEWRVAETKPTSSIYLSSIIWGYTYEPPEGGTASIFPLVIDIVLKGDKSSKDWISGKSTIYSDYKKLKDITVGGVNTQILVKDIETDKGGKIFVPKNNYVYIIGISDYISTETRDKVLSTLQFLD